MTAMALGENGLFAKPSFLRHSTMFRPTIQPLVLKAYCWLCVVGELVCTVMKLKLFYREGKTVMKLMECMIVLLLTVLPGLASAEFYRYEDEQGNVHFTDDLSDVPVEARPKADQYEEPSREPAAEKQVEPKKEQEGAPKEPGAPKNKESAAQPSLRERGMELDAEYQLLMKERQELELAAKEPLTPATQAELAEKIKDFNKRMQDYEKRRIVFNEEVEAYNASLKKGTSPPPPKAEKE
jgi:hypothetical protein